MFGPTVSEMMEVYAPRISRWDNETLMEEIRKAEAKGPDITLASKPDRAFRCAMTREMLRRNETLPDSHKLRLK